MNDQERGNGFSTSNDFQASLRGHRRRVEELAHMLATQSRVEWRRAIEGVVSLPAAFITSAASTTLFAVGFVTRGFEVFEEVAAAERERMLRTSHERASEIGREGRNEQGQLNPNAPRA